MKKFLLVIALLLSSTELFSSYTFGGLDTTANGGTGFNQSGTPGYIISDMGSSAVDIAYGTAVQPDGKIIVVGQKGTTLMAMVRYTINGALDTTFDTDGIVTQGFGASSSCLATAVRVLPNGKIVVVGQADNTFFVAQFLANGSLDTSFASGSGYVLQNVKTTATVSTDIANAVTADSSGNIYVAGTSVQSGFGNIFVAKFNSAGTLQTGTYNSGATVYDGGPAVTTAGIALISTTSKILAGNALALNSSGKVVVAGMNSTDNYIVVARFNTDGTIDTTFDTDGITSTNLGGATAVAAYAVGFQTQGGNAGKIIVAGTASGGIALVRFTTTGTLDTTFGISSSGYNRTSLGAVARGMIIQPDDTIIVGGTDNIGTTNCVIAQYLADGSGLNTSFNSPAGFNNTALGSGADIGNALAIQQNGSFVVAGLNNSADFITARYLGTQGVQGAMDLSYQNFSSPGFKTYPTTNTPTAQAQVVAIYPKSVTLPGSLYVVTSNSGAIGVGSSQVVLLNSSGVNSGGPTNVAVGADTIRVQDVIEDSVGRAVVVGTDTTAGAGFILRYKPDAGNLPEDTTFTMGNVSASSSFKRVGEQQAGRLVVIGQAATSSTGLLIAYNESGALANSSQSLAPAFGDGLDGSITMANATFHELLIDSSDAIYVAFQPTGGNISIAKYLADGSALDTGFGTSGIYDTGLSIASHGVPVMAFDASGNIVVAAIVSGSGDITFVKISSLGVLSSSGTINQSTTLLSTPVLNKLQCDSTNRLVFAGYDNNNFFVARCGAGLLTLDATFAPYAACPGILKTNYEDNNPTDGTTPKRVATSVGIATTGNILFGGYENITGSTTVSLVGQVVGDTTTPATQVARYPGALLEGTLNLNFGTNGALDIHAAPASVATGQPHVFQVLEGGPYNGNIVVATTNGTATTLTMLNSFYVKDTSVFDSGSIFFSQIDIPQAFLADPTGEQYYILGANAAVYKFSDNSTIGTIFQSSNLNSGNAYALAQQSSGRILVGGYDVARSSGVIVAYTPAGQIDTSFNPGGSGGSTYHIPGYWYTGRPHPVTSISIGTQESVLDKIYYAMTNSLGNAVVIRLLENGTGFDTSYVFGSTINSVSDDTQVKMQLDENGKIVLVVNTGSTGGIQAARYTMNGADDVVPATIINDAIGQNLENILCLNDETTLVLVAQPNAVASSAVMNLARLDAAFQLDSAFNPLGSTPGILTTNVPAAGNTPVMKDFYGVDVSSTGQILVSGDNDQTASSADAYFAGIVNSSTLARVSQSATSLGVPGELNTNFNTTGANPGFMNLTNEISTVMPAGTIGKVLLQNSDGAYYVAGSDDTNTYIAFLNADNVQDTVFGLEGRVTITDCTDVAAMMFTQDDNLLKPTENPAAF